MKKIFFLMLAVLLTGCARAPSQPQAALEVYEEDEDEVTQVYDIQEVPNPYETLVPVTLTRQDAYIGVFMISAEDATVTETSAFSEKAGISLGYDLSGDSLYTAMMDKNDQIKEALGDIGYERSETDSVIKFTYQIEEEDAIYPCAVIIVGEKTEAGSLITTIGIDNTKGSGDTEKILTEVLDAAGVEAMF